MVIRKCDLCNKVIKNDTMVSAGMGLNLWAKTLCYKCGKPVVNFLKKKKLYKEDEKPWQKK